MQRLTITALVILLVVGTAAAAKMKAIVDYDRSFDFQTIKTFAYYETLETSVVDSAAPVHEMVKILIIKHLKKSGLQEVKENPDIYVTYHTDEKQAMRMNVTLYSYSYSAGWWWSPLWGSGMDVSSYSQGTLIVDAWTPANDTLIWRGTVIGIVPEDPSPQKAQKTIEKALNAISKEWRKTYKKGR